MRAGYSESRQANQPAHLPLGELLRKKDYHPRELVARGYSQQEINFAFSKKEQSKFLAARNKLVKKLFRQKLAVRENARLKRNKQKAIWNKLG